MNGGPESFEERFRAALEQTKVHRARRTNLFTFGATRLPYIFAAESAVNRGETVVRTGEIVTEKPNLILPEEIPTFSGFQTDDGEGRQLQLVFGRLFRFPAVHCRNDGVALEVVPGEMERVVDGRIAELDRSGNSRTAVISGREDLWHISLMVYAGEMMHRSAPDNIREMLERRHLDLLRGGMN